MSAICEYQHKKFTLKTEANSHKNFSLPMKKRKHDDFMEDKENIVTAETILEKALKDIQPEQPQAKRRQTKPLFRPWLDEEDSNKSKTNSSDDQKKITVTSHVLSTIPSNVMTYNPNMVRQHAIKPRTEKEQQRRNRNTLACLINRRHKQAEQLMLQQQYVAHQQQQAALMDQSVRAALYLRHLQQLTLQRQHQLFVFGNQY